MSRETNGIGRGALVTCWRTVVLGIGTSTGSLSTFQPFERFPQWMQLRKMEPGEQVTPKS